MRNKYKWVYETSKKQFTILYVLYHQWYNKVTLQNALQLFEKYPKIIREICNTTTSRFPQCASNIIQIHAQTQSIPTPSKTPLHERNTIQCSCRLGLYTKKDMYWRFERNCITIYVVNFRFSNSPKLFVFSLKCGSSFVIPSVFFHNNL